MRSPRTVRSTGQGCKGFGVMKKKFRVGGAHYNVSGQSDLSEIGMPIIKGTRKVLPAHVIREINLKAAQQGGLAARCHFCKCLLPVAYCKQVKISMFMVEWVCRDCRRAQGLEKSGSVLR